VAYRGSGPAGIAFAGGEVQVMINSASIAMSQVKTGRVRVLAVASAQPSALAPGVPTAAAAGLPGYETGSLTGLFGPANMSRTLIGRLNRETVQVLNQANVKELFLNAGIEAVGSTPEQFAALLKSDVSRWSKLIRKLGIVEE
jgi:tripartite-type tricarboxylate transporter receptor subunit TctC